MGARRRSGRRLSAAARLACRPRPRGNRFDACHVKTSTNGAIVKGDRMKHLLNGVGIAVVLAVATPALAQTAEDLNRGEMTRLSAAPAAAAPAAAAYPYPAYPYPAYPYSAYPYSAYPYSYPYPNYGYGDSYYGYGGYPSYGYGYPYYPLGVNFGWG